MKYTVKLMTTSALAMAMSTFGSAYAFADCELRIFYNHSNVPWTIVMGKNAGACSDGPDGNKISCTIPPLGAGEIHYKSTFWMKALDTATKAMATANGGGPSGGPSAPDGSILIMSADGGKIYPAKYFDIENGPTKCYLKHNESNTGNVVLNTPADGDIVTCGKAQGGNYDCKQ
jgi:hypothetical protein